MRHLKQMNFTLFKELFNLPDGCRKINEDIAALRNIAWAINQRAIKNQAYNSFGGYLYLLLSEYNPQDITSLNDWREATDLTVQ